MSCKGQSLFGGAGDEMHMSESYEFNYENDIFLIPYINTHEPKSCLQNKEYFRTHIAIMQLSLRK